MKIYSGSDIGLMRDENQDEVWGEMLTDNACAAVLCDGMGGGSRGGLASSMTVDIVSRRLKESFSEQMNRNSVRNLMITAVIAANSIVHEAAGEDKDIIMGTTCVTALVFNGRAHIVNVGDSRAYHLFEMQDDECIRQITRDHSHVRDLIERGKITEEEAKTHPSRNKITRAIGAERNVTPDYFEIDMKTGEMLLLCSDGLSSYVDDMDILDLCFDSKPDACCAELIKAANGSGGHDNVSVALIKV